MDQNNDPEGQANGAGDKGIDLSGALDDSSSDIKFEGEEFQRLAQSFQSQTPKVIQWVIKYSGGLVKDRKQASYVLLGFVAVAIIISLFLFFSSSGNEAKIEAPIGQKVIYPQDGPPRLR